MRGKNLIWLSLIAALLASTMVGVGLAPGATKMFITPTAIPGGSTMGHIGDTFEMSVNIENIVDLWSLGFTVKYAPYGRPIVSGFVLEGDFLKQGGYNTNFVYKIDTFAGELKIAITRLFGGGVPVGASGSGVLATFVFTVAEAGDSDYELIDVTMRDSNFDPITNFATAGGSYNGIHANLVKIEMPAGRVNHVGDPINFLASAKSTSDVPLNVRVRYDIERLEDGRRIRIYSGQNYAGGGMGEPAPFEWVYASGYLGGGDGSWSNPGALVGEPDGTFSECTTAYGATGYYTFNLDLAGRTVLQCDLQGYTAQPDGSTGWDFDPYVDFYDSEGTYLTTAWCDSLGGFADWRWTGGRYYQGSAYDMPEYYMSAILPWSEELFNNMELMIENYCPSGPRQQIDALRWKVEFAAITPVAVPSYELAPNDNMDLPPMTIGVATEDMIGTYVLTATLEYTGTGGGETAWPQGIKTRTISFAIRP